jgi:hypothetical protein
MGVINGFRLAFNISRKNRSIFLQLSDNYLLESVMAKALSPIRLQQDLMAAASLAGEIHHRSTAEQVEYWASLGRKVANILDPEAVLAIGAGTVTLKLEPVSVGRVDPGEAFSCLERDCESGALAASVAPLGIRYQSSQTCPGFLERIDAEGKVEVGQYHLPRLRREYREYCVM